MNKVRYIERTEVGDLVVENIIHIWDGSVDIFQKYSMAGNYENNQMVGLSKQTALKFAEMIISNYKDGGND